MAKESKLESLRAILQTCIYLIDNGAFDRLTDDTIENATSIIAAAISPDEKLNKTEAANFMHMSTRQFDRYISYGIIPKGKKKVGSSSLYWSKRELNNLTIKHKNKSNL